MLIENPEPAFGPIPTPRERRHLHFVIRPVMRENLRVDEPIAKISIQAGVKPVPPFVHLRPQPQVRRVGRGPEFVGKILDNRRAFRQPEIAVLQNGDATVRIHDAVGLLEMFAREQIDHLEVKLNPVLGGRQHHWRLVVERG